MISGKVCSIPSSSARRVLAASVEFLSVVESVSEGNHVST